MKDINKENADIGKSGPIMVESFWGALASIPILQVFGFLVFQTFIYSSLVLDLLSLIFLIAYLTEQTILFSKINNYVYNKKHYPHQLNLKDIIKITIGLLFLFLWLAFILGKYPFPKGESSSFHTILFYLVSWFISGGLLIIKKSPKIILTESVNKNKRGLLILVLLPFVYLAMLAPKEVIYLFLMIPLFSIYVLLVSWMVEA